MLITFESSKSERVLSLSFHPTRPWILGGLASGKIKIWDYLEKELVFSSRDHKGAVCGVDFHRSKEMFVTGGKDKSIHGWDCQKQRLIFTLLGHKDTINTLQFHKEYPWIVSASNDGTIRIWNWQSRTCVYAWNVSSTPIMCASFAPGGYIVFADSVDHTVRLWDAKALDKGKVSPAVDHPLLMVPDTTTLQGHQDRVNSASSHPSHSSRIVSCANDFTVNSWHISDETKRWELGTLVGHMDHVSSAVFHPTKDDIVVSASKDKSIRVWDTISQTEIHTFCSGGGDRFWSLAAHPEKSLLAAGHDHGLIVFKLERERPAFALSGDSLVFIKDNVLCSYEFSTEAESQLIPLRLPTTLNQSPRTLSYSRKDNAALIFSHLNGGSYELYVIPEDSSGIVREAKRGTGRSAVFVDNSLFAVLEKTTNQVSVRNLNNEVVFTRSLTIPAESIFYAGTGVLLCSSAVKVVLFDLMRNQVISHLNTPNIVRNIVWSSDQQRLALLSKDTIIIASKKLVLQCTLRETTHVKSGVWDDNNVFIYTTLSHLKCCFPNGKSEIVRYLDTPFYISKVSGNTIFYLDRNGDCLTTTIDAAGCRSVLASRFDMADDGEEYAQGKGWATVDIEDLPSDSEGPPSVIEMEEMSPFPVFQVEGEGEGEGDGWENFNL